MVSPSLLALCLVGGAAARLRLRMQGPNGLEEAEDAILPSAVPDVQITTGDTYSMYRHSHPVLIERLRALTNVSKKQE